MLIEKKKKKGKRKRMIDWRKSEPENVKVTKKKIKRKVGKKKWKRESNVGRARKNGEKKFKEKEGEILVENEKKGRLEKN